MTFSYCADGSVVSKLMSPVSLPRSAPLRSATALGAVGASSAPAMLFTSCSNSQYPSPCKNLPCELAPASAWPACGCSSSLAGSNLGSGGSSCGRGTSTGACADTCSEPVLTRAGAVAARCRPTDVSVSADNRVPTAPAVPFASGFCASVAASSQLTAEARLYDTACAARGGTGVGALSSDRDCVCNGPGGAGCRRGRMWELSRRC